MLDIDDFKQVNDTYGHLQGDEVLRMVGRVLQPESRGVDEPARYGGEEFAVALPETGLGGRVELAERIRARIESERVTRRRRPGALRVTASVGAASMPGFGRRRARPRSRRPTRRCTRPSARARTGSRPPRRRVPRARP